MDKQPKVAIAFERVVVIRLKLVSLQMDKQLNLSNLLESSNLQRFLEIKIPA